MRYTIDDTISSTLILSLTNFLSYQLILYYRQHYLEWLKEAVGQFGAPAFPLQAIGAFCQAELDNKVGGPPWTPYNPDLLK